MSSSSPIPPTDVECKFCGVEIGVPCRAVGVLLRKPNFAHMGRIWASNRKFNKSGQPATEAVSRSEGSTKEE